MKSEQHYLPVSTLLVRLWHHFPRWRKGQFVLLLGLMVVASFAEVVSIGAVLPFLGVLTAPERLFHHPGLQKVIALLGVTAPNQLLLPLTIFFGFAAIFTGCIRLVLLWASTRFSFATGADLSISIFRRSLYQPYAVHVSRNSSEIISAITSKTNGAINIILMVMNLLGCSVMLISILMALLLVDPTIALTAFAGFGLIYSVIIRLTRKRLLRNSRRIAHESTQVIKSLQEGLGGIRDVVIDGTQSFYCRIYNEADIKSRRAQGSSTFISGSPRFAMEALGMLLIAALAYVLAQRADGVAKAIPTLGALALGAQRLLPVLQLAYSSLTNIRGDQVFLQETLELLDQPIPEYAEKTDYAPLVFQKQITLNKLSFRYGPHLPWILKDLDLIIERGSRIGFIGTTGSGKSTLLDIIMALLEPVDGSLEIDGIKITPERQRAWQKHIAHVPQAIFLADSSVEENIAFGIPPHLIDHERVVQSARQAQIAEAIETWPEGYQTRVGERGVRLSGGQRQRIGIARAFYKKADVIIFDEATSALDGKTESSVMDAIESLSNDITVLLIAHRTTTLKNCTKVIELSGGQIKRIASYNEIINS